MSEYLKPDQFVHSAPDNLAREPFVKPALSPRPTIGRIVIYRLSADVAANINRRREDALAHMKAHRANASGVQIHFGDRVEPGEGYPLLVTRSWGDRINGQVMLDGNDTYWIRNVFEGVDEPGTWSWPPRV